MTNWPPHAHAQRRVLRVTLGRSQGRRVVTLATSTVKKGIVGNGRASKEDVAKAVVTRYPELRAYLAQSTKWRARYQANRLMRWRLGLWRGLRSNTDRLVESVYDDDRAS